MRRLPVRQNLKNKILLKRIVFFTTKTLRHKAKTKFYKSLRLSVFEVKDWSNRVYFFQLFFAPKRPSDVQWFNLYTLER